MRLNHILSVLNDLAPDYRFGGLQEIRRQRRPLQKRPSRHPFGSVREDWAHHVGGRQELQFNIGDDEDMLRWGIAISLQPSRSLPDVTVHHPRLRKLSSLLETHGNHLERRGFEMWDWMHGQRSRNRAPRRVADDLYRPGSFVFVGRQAPYEEFDPHRVLRDFDTLLPVYEFVEFEPHGAPPAFYTQRGFVFEPDPPTTENRARATTATRTPGISQVSLRHGVLQDALKTELQREGAVVSTENRDGRGGYVDLVAFRDGEYEFYEIKTDATPRLAIRHAVGQLLEYAYWPAPARPKRLVVATEHPLDAEAADYLRTLETETGLAISYRRICLSP